MHLLSDECFIKFLIPIFILEGAFIEPAVRKVVLVPCTICRDVDMTLCIVAKLPACYYCYSVSKHVLTQLSSIVAVLCLPEDDVGFAKEVGGIKKTLKNPFLLDLNLHLTIFFVEFHTILLILLVKDCTAIVERDDSWVLGDFIG